MTITTLHVDQGAKPSYEFNWDPSGSIRGNLDDASDATWADGHGSGNKVQLSMDSMTVTAGDRVKRVKIKPRIARSSTGTGMVETLKAILRDSSTGAQTSVVDAWTTSTVAWFTKEGGWRNAAPGGAEWTETLVNRVQVQLNDVAGSNGTTYARVSELTLDVETNSPPVVTSPTVTGSSTTNRPTVSWTYSDVDGDPQIAYRVWVYSAAQYGAPGFAPITSAATWYSGYVYTNNTSTVVGTPLVNGVTYKAYVGAVQDFNGQNWTGTVVATSTFTISLSPPDAPSIDALTVDSNRLRTSITTTGRINALTADNASLESTVGNWAAVTNCSVARSTTGGGSHGAANLTMTSSASGTMTTRCGQQVLVTVGTTYTALAELRTAVSARTCTIAIEWYTVGNSLISTTTGTGVADSTGGWTQITAAGAAPATASYAKLLITVASTGGASEVHRADKMSLAPGSSTTWGPGGLLSTSVVQLLAADLADRAGNLASPTVAAGGDVEASTNGFALRGTGTLTYSTTPDLQWQGEGALDWLPGTSQSPAALDIGFTAGAFTDSYALPVAPGTTYTFSLYAYGVANATTWDLEVLGYDALGNRTGSNGSATITSQSIPLSTWTRLSVTFTPTSLDRWARAGLFRNTSGTQHELRVDGIQWETGSSATEWRRGHGQAPVYEVVHGLDALDPEANSAQQLQVWDYTAKPGIPRIYKAQTVVTLSTGELLYSTAAAASSHEGQLAVPTSWWLRDPDNAHLTLAVTVLSQDQEVFEDAQVLRPLGRTAAVVVGGALGGTDGQLELLTVGHAQWSMVEPLVRSQTPLLLSSPTGETSTVRLTGRPIKPAGTAGQPQRTITLAYVEVDL